MTKAIIVKRRIKVGDGEVTIPLKMFTDQEQAVEFAKGNHLAMSSLLDKVIADGLTVSQFLGHLGIMGFKPEIETVELEGSRIQVAQAMPRLS